MGEDIAHDRIAGDAKAIFDDVELDALPDEAAPLVVFEVAGIGLGVGIEGGLLPPARRSGLVGNLRWLVGGARVIGTCRWSRAGAGREWLRRWRGFGLKERRAGRRAPLWGRDPGHRGEAEWMAGEEENEADQLAEQRTFGMEAVQLWTAGPNWEGMAYLLPAIRTSL